MKIALAQIQAAKGDINKNIEKHCRFIKTAVDNRADAIFFPELSVTGYEPELAKELATTHDDERLAIFQSLSDESNIVIGVGLPTINQFGIRISMIVFQPHKSKQIYSKQHLHDDELPYFVPGNEQIYIIIGKSKMALAICYESLLPQHAEKVNKEGINIYLASVAKSANGVTKAYRHYPDIAKKYAIYVLMANCVGYCDNFESIGSSAAWNSNGELVGKLDEKGEGLLIFDTETEESIIISQTNILS